MELKWLEDFVLLAQVKNFGKAAELRNVTQPAFSRRIRALELWLGSSLVDRSCFPMELTAAGLYFYDQAVLLIKDIVEVRSTLSDGSVSDKLVIDFAVSHNLSISFFPEWIKLNSRFMQGASYRLNALNVHDAVMSLLGGGSDLLLTYTHPIAPLHLNPNLYESRLLGVESLGLYRSANFPCKLSDQSLECPFLAYGAGAYLGKIADHVIAKSGGNLKLRKVYETDMAEGLKAMMLAGHGVAFLPQSCVQRELQDGSALEVLEVQNLHQYLKMEIRLFRRSDSRLDDDPKLLTSEASHYRKKRVVDSLWCNLGNHDPC